jgi:hypothetical protein
LGRYDLVARSNGEVAHAAALDIDRQHVRGVEQARIAPHRVMLLDLRAVVERHLPAREINPLRLGLAGRGMERGLVQAWSSGKQKRGRAGKPALPLCPFT